MNSPLDTSTKRFTPYVIICPWDKWLSQQQEKLERTEKRDFRRKELSGKFTARMLYGWDNGKFEEEYLKKLERNWRR